MQNALLEIACFNLESALIAQSSGANRIELCEQYAEGGVTPSQEMIAEARKKISIPLHVIIRPRGGNFIYSKKEIEQMKADILFCKTQQINGVVFGALTNNNEIDLPVCKELIELARPMSVTFHRAIDVCTDLKKAVEQLIMMGVDRVLTSGQSADAAIGVAQLKMLHDLFVKQIIIMPGGGLRSANIKAVMASGCYEYHSSAIKDQIEMADAEEIKNLQQILMSL